MAKGILGFFFGAKPKVPEFKKVDVASEQQAAIAGNAAALPGAENLASNVNQFNMSEIAKALEFALPGGLKMAQGNISNQLSGISDISDTQAGIRNATAAGWSGGTAGSQFGNLKVIGQLGRSVSAQKQQGLQNFMGLSQAMTPKLLDVSSMFFTPQQRVATAVSNNENQFNKDWLQSQINAAPNPVGAFSMELIKDVAKGAAAGVGFAAFGCWVARSVYGEHNPRWVMFRQWMIEDAPKWFLWIYNRFGERIADAIRPFPWIKSRIRAWMDSKIDRKYAD